LATSTKKEEKKKESINSRLLVLLDVLPIDVVATTSPGATVIIVVRVDASTSLMVSSGGVAS
jgi:hypothetical protein